MVLNTEADQATILLSFELKQKIIMKVIYDYQIFDWQEYGGISRYYYELVKYFTRNHICEPIIIAPLHVNKYISSLNNDVVFGQIFPNY